MDDLNLNPGRAASSGGADSRMGAGASAALHEGITGEEAAAKKAEAEKTLTPEAMKKIAFQAMQDVLKLSATQTVAMAKKQTTWEMEEYKIPVPGSESLQTVVQEVEKVRRDASD